jgi:hypothetical protein
MVLATSLPVRFESMAAGIARSGIEDLFRKNSLSLEFCLPQNHLQQMKRPSPHEVTQTMAKNAEETTWPKDSAPG